MSDPAEAFVEPGDIAVPPAAVNQVVRAIGIMEYELVDGLRASVKLPNQRLAEAALDGTGLRFGRKIIASRFWQTTRGMEAPGIEPDVPHRFYLAKQGVF